MSATGQQTGDFPCPGCGNFGCLINHQPYQVWVAPPIAAGHCGKCGAPYTSTIGSAFEPMKFHPTCKCWNV